MLILNSYKCHKSFSNDQHSHLSSLNGTLEKAGRFSGSPCIRGKVPKNLPNLKSEYLTIISLQNLLLSQTYVSLGNSYISMVEQFHQLDYGRFGVLTVQVTNLSAEVFMVYNHIRLIRNRSYIGR